MKVIGIHGAKRAGKDTLAGLICAHHGYGQVSFADPIRAMLEILPIPSMYKQDKNVVIPSLGKTYTELCQSLGTEWGRTMVRDDLWLILAGMKADSHKNNLRPGVVFSDIRNRNEADMVRQMGGKIIYLQSNRSVVVNCHSSEKVLPNSYIDEYLRNDGSIDDLWTGFTALRLI